MKQNTSITKIMSADVIAATYEMKVSEIRKLMETHHIHHMPVMSGKKLIGLVSAVDILRASFSSALVGAGESDEVLDHTIALEDVMTAEPVTIKSTDTIKHAAEILSTSNYNSLPVVNENDELVGIVTTKDLIGYLLDQY